MRSLRRWEPFNELVSLREVMDRLFEDSFVRPGTPWPARLGASTLPLDVYETEDDVVVKATVPGAKPEDIEITITGDTLSIRGEAKEKTEVKRENYIRQERRYGAFSRSVTLPTGLETDKVEASFEDGVLTLNIPKAEEVKPKVIKVKTSR